MRLFCVETLFHAFLDLVVGVPCAVVSLLWPLRTYVHEDVPVKKRVKWEVKWVKWGCFCVNID